jgi:hypothetical protein
VTETWDGSPESLQESPQESSAERLAAALYRNETGAADVSGWYGLSESSRHDWRQRAIEARCEACSDCTEPYGHLTPHTCDCAEAWG